MVPFNSDLHATIAGAPRRAECVATIPGRRNRAQSCFAAPTHPIALLARSLSDVFPRRPSAEDPVEAAFQPLCGQALAHMLSMHSSAEEVQRHVGVRAEHVAVIAKESTHQDSAIGIRFVEPAASHWIARGYHTKNLTVPGKTANWGPMRGFVPVAQVLSKLMLQKRERIAEANCAVRSMLQKERYAALDQFGGVHNAEGRRMQIVDTPLTISTQDLLAHYPDLELVEGADDITFRDEAVPSVLFVAHRNCNDWTFTYSEGDKLPMPINIIAYQDRGCDGALRGRPQAITADYDLLLLMPSIRAHGSKDNRPVPLVTAANYKAYRGMHIVDADKMAQRERDLLDLHKPVMGNASRRVEELIERLNRAFSAQSLEGAGVADRSDVPTRCGARRPLIQHSDDLGNPFADPKTNYPALIVLPKSLAHYVRNTARGMVVQGHNAQHPRPHRVSCLAGALSAVDVSDDLRLDAPPYFVAKDHTQFVILYNVLRDVLHFVGAPNPLWHMR